MEFIPVVLYNNKGKITISPPGNPFNNKNYLDIKTEYINLIKPYRETGADQFIGGQPVQLEKHCIYNLLRKSKLNNDLAYYVTLKADGDRYLMFKTESGVVYFIDRSTNIAFFTGSKMLEPGNRFLFDGELVRHEATGEYEFLLFDVIFYNNESYMGNNYFERMSILQLFESSMKSLGYPIIPLSIKSWYNINTLTGDFYKNVILKTKKNRSHFQDLKADGLILQPFDAGYVPFRSWVEPENVQFKWKPIELLTIDFQVKIISPKIWELLTRSTGSKPQNFSIKDENGEAIKAICTNFGNFVDLVSDGDIVEFKYIRSNFIPYKMRSEKNEPNSYLTAMSTISAIKNFFNLGDYKTEIDVASGKGTDTTKFLMCYPKIRLASCANTIVFDPSVLKKINSVFKEYSFGGTHELELRIANVGKGNTFSKSDFFYLLSFFKLLYGPKEYERTIEVIDTDNNLRSTYSAIEFDRNSEFPRIEIVLQLGDHIKTIEKKSKKSQKMICSQFNVKIDVSTETEKKKDKIPVLKDNGNGNLLRHKLRNSYEIGLWRVDFTIVKTDYSLKNLFNANEKYELECEFISKIEIGESEFIESLSVVYNLILHNHTYCYK
jgi:hypothetical protein